MRSLHELHAAEQRETAERAERIARVHDEEMGVVLAEIGDIAAELDALAGADGAANAPSAGDGATASPKRAKWLAEQDAKKAPLSRRDLLRGRPKESGPSA